MGRAERRVVTVLFADLVGSTRLVESLDPEAARARLDAMFRRMAAEVRRLDGSVEKYLGDAILAVFGYPTAHGDDAARAMRAALALRDVARSLSAELTDFPPRLRIGLDTGEVVAGAFAGDLRVSGEAVHTAARIQQAAAPDQILARVLSGAIGRLVEGAWPEPETAGTAAGVCRLIGLEPDERAGPPSQLGARELAATVAGVLARLAEADPTLVVLEDIHWASRDLLEVAAILVTTSTRSGHRLGFLGIARPEAPALASAWTAGAGAERIDLASLPSGATSRLLAATVGEQVNPDMAKRVFEASHGPFLSGDLVETARLLEEALDLSLRDNRPGLAIDLRLTLLPVRLHLATPLGEVAAQAQELAAAARAHGRRNAEAGANWALGEIHALQGDLDSAERRFLVADRQLRDIGLSFQLVWSLLGLARVAIARGAPERARRLAEEAIEITSRPDGVAEPDAFVHLAEAYLVEGDLEAAAAAIRRARASLQPGDAVLHAEVERVEAHLAGARGDHQAAVSLLRHALTITDYRLDWLRTAAQLVPALVNAGLRDDAAEVAGEVRRHAEAIGAHALAQGLPGAAP